MKRRDWGELLSVFDGRERKPLGGRSAPRVPLAELLDKAERDERQGRLPFAGPDVARGVSVATETTIGTNNGGGPQEGVRREHDNSYGPPYP